MTVTTILADMYDDNFVMLILGWADDHHEEDDKDNETHGRFKWNHNKHDGVNYR